MILFFGDSLTQGENCKHNFTHYLPSDWEVYNLAVSGTTIGEYSIYPVDGDSLLGQIAKHQDAVSCATDIFIEYGSNDVSAVMCGFATVKTITVSFVKAVDWIKQLNPKAHIYFLAFSGEDVIYDRAERMCAYLKSDYFKDFDFEFPVSVYVKTYNQMIDNISKVCDIITMFDSTTYLKGDRDAYMSDDNIHPNEIGHKMIAGNIVKQYRILQHIK
jgi:lysophospholipase L1-like esterase